MDSGVTQHAVVIAGGGPTGLMLAGELALANVDVAIVERRENQELAGRRAGGLHARSIEVLDQRGIADRFVAQGQKYPSTTYGHIPVDLAKLPTRHNYTLGLWQNHIERLLAEWVAGLNVVFYRGCDVTGLAQDDAGVDVILGDGKTLRAQYLIGCDGGRSLVRKKAGIDFVGWDASQSSIIAEVTMTEAPEGGLRRDAKGVYAMGPIEGTENVRVVLRDEEVRQNEPTVEDLREALVTLYGRDFGLRDVIWLSRFTDAARQAATYRKQRVLLAGDAAHTHSPIGGQGLNTGLQDAVNLGWKLAQVVKGTSPDALLDTYHAERHPVGARVLRMTMAQTALTRVDDRMEALREVFADTLKLDEPSRRYAAQCAALDIHYDLGSGHPLLGRRMPDLDIVVGGEQRRVFSLLHQARAVLLDLGSSVDITGWAGRVQYVQARYAGTWELPALGPVDAAPAVLIRPDGHVAWVSDGSAAGLRDALTATAGPPSPGG